VISITGRAPGVIPIGQPGATVSGRVTWIAARPRSSPPAIGGELVRDRRAAEGMRTLKNPVRVEALHDRGETERATLTNLLQRRGDEDSSAEVSSA
jgi:hypothetical protein